VGALIILAFVGAALALAVYQPRTALLVGLFLGGWGGLDVDLGLRLTAYQLVMAPLCLVCLVRLLYPGQAPKALHLGWPFAAMLLYALINSAFQVASLPEVSIDNSVLRSPGVRAVIQILLFLFSLSPVVLVPWLFDKPGDVLTLLRVWMASTLLLAVAGFVQLAIWYGTGVNPLPLGFSNALLGGATPALREGIVNLDGLFIFRMNSFAPEPRFLGTSFGLGMVIVQGIALAMREIRAARLFGMWLFLLVAMLLTYSTSGIAVWLLGTLALLPAMWVCRVPVQRSVRVIGGVALAVVVPLAVAVIVADDAGIPVVEIINERTIERFTLEAALEDFDLAIGTWLAAEPDKLWLGGGLGNAHLFATPYLLPEHAGYAEGQVFSAKTLILRYLSEQGIVGLSLFMLFILSRIIGAAWVRAVPWLAPMLPLSLALMVMVIGSAQLLTEVWFVAGTLVMLIGYRARALAQRSPPPPFPAPVAA
jgi:hypothetical protein